MASTFNSDEFKHGRFDITTQQQKRKIRKGKVKPNQSSTIKLQLLAKFQFQFSIITNYDLI